MRNKVFSEIIIDENIETVYSSYFDINKWKYILSDVLEVNLITNSETFQEFEMTVYKNFQKERVYSKRYCNPNNLIRLEQLVPPPQVISMDGSWEFVSLEPTKTLVRAERRFEMEDSNNLEEYSSMLLESLEKNLNHFKNYIEKIGIIELSLEIPAKIGTVKQLFWNIKAWDKIWEKVYSVDVNFDNGTLQDFSMTVERDGEVEHIRTIQEKDLSGNILLYSAVPPAKLQIHHGAWRFIDLGETTGVVCRRVFKMSKEYQSEFEAYKEEFQKRLNSILNAFKDYYLNGGEDVN